MDEHTIFIKLKNIFAYLYLDSTDAKRIATDAGLNLEQITFDTKAINYWHNLLVEAIESNRLGILLDRTLEEYPQNQTLVSISETYHRLVNSGGYFKAPPAISGSGVEVKGDFVSRDKIVHGDSIAGDKLEIGQVNIHSRSPYEEVDIYMSRAIPHYEIELLHINSSTNLPEKPYMFLYPFTMGEQSIFFGRDLVVEQLLEQIDHQSKLTVLHASSGAGKSSLLGAGIMPHLLKKRCLPLYVAVHQDAADPVLAIKKILTPESQGTWPQLLSQLTLSTYLGMAMRHMSRRFEELVLILDQFEAFFVFNPEEEHRQQFLSSIASCLNSLSVRFVISIRKDYYSDLAYFDKHLPHIFHNQYLLRPMHRSEAKVAITGPVKAVDPSVTFEDELLETLLNDLASREVSLPHLQIICSQLYENRDSLSMLTLPAYKELGGIEGIVGRYLQEVLDQMGGDYGIAREILTALITSRGTKRILNQTELQEELAVKLSVDYKKIESVLDRLVVRRLLQRIEKGGIFQYQIAHESLAAEIQNWADPNVLEVKKAQELLTAELTAWKSHNTLIPSERLDFLYPHRHQLLIDQETLSCLFTSALAVNQHPEDWFALYEERKIPKIVTDLSNLLEREDISANISSTLAELGALVAFALTKTLNHKKQRVRDISAQTLGKIGAEAKVAVPALTRALDRYDDAEYRQLIIKALGSIGMRADLVVPKLIRLLKDQNQSIEIRKSSAQALGRIGQEAEAAIHIIKGVVHDKNEDSLIRLISAQTLFYLGRVVDPFVAKIQKNEIFIMDPIKSITIRKENLADGLSLEMALIPGNTFLMGSPELEEGHTRYENQHQVTVQSFFMSIYPITQAQWKAVAALPKVERELDPTPSHFKGENLPVEQISWLDAKEFCARSSRKKRHGYRLPSEAEWEYACRGGTITPFHFGETITTDLANYCGIDRQTGETQRKGSYASGPKGDYREKTTPVGSFCVVNNYGLYDMHGNVMEMCSDIWRTNHADEDGKSIDSPIIVRGGNWMLTPDYSRSAFRGTPFQQSAVSFNVGFRVCYTVDELYEP